MCSDYMITQMMQMFTLARTYLMELSEPSTFLKMMLWFFSFMPPLPNGLPVMLILDPNHILDPM